MDQLAFNSAKLIIAGPCALESREGLRECITALKKIGVNHIRAPLWKPRTRPGWDGIGEDGLRLLLEETIPRGVVPATEIITAEHAQIVVEAIESYDRSAQMIVWLGARNQNHIEQKKIARILAKGPPGITLFFKNQMWDDEVHWVGIYEHLISEGFPPNRLMACHRGFSPGKSPNPKGLRNLPDFAMAMRVKEKIGIPMLFDPSHIGGEQEAVMDVCLEASLYNFDGYLIEMHMDPKRALTDQNQQLSPTQLEALLEEVRTPQAAIL